MRRIVSVLMLVMGMAGGAAAQGAAKVAPVPAATQHPGLVGAEELTKVSAPSGFIDDAVATDADRIAYVVADSTTKAELHVLTLSTKQEVVIDISPTTLTPVSLAFAKDRVIVIGEQDDGKFIAAAVELTAKSKTKPVGTVAWKSAPATHLTLITRDGKQRLAHHNVTTTGTAGGTTKHEMQLLALETGKRAGSLRSLSLENDANAKLSFKVNHWSDGWTKATGIKAGEWDKKEDQKLPDAEATFDLVTGKLGPRVEIKDLYEQRRRFQTLAEANGESNFVRYGLDNTSLQLWSAGKMRTLELDQPSANYDRKTLQGLVLPDGSAWIAFKVDPVNPDAVARKKADPEYLDIFYVAAGETKAMRKSRVLASKIRHRMFAAPSGFLLLERNQGFERGGKSLTLYRPQ